MNIAVEKLPNCAASLRVEIPQDVVQSERTTIVKKYKNGARIPGFRQGKAPDK